MKQTLLSLKWLIITLVLAGCAGSIPQFPSEESQSMNEFEQVECKEFELPPEGVSSDFWRNVKMICGFVTVPEYHRKPNGATIRLAAIKFVSPNSDPDPTPLVFEQGGPGLSSIELLSALIPRLKDILNQRDIIAIEQRGTGHSKPSLHCDEIWKFLLQSLRFSPQMEDAAEKRTAVQACYKRYMSGGVNPSAYNSVENAADIRAAVNILGYEKFNLFGMVP